VRFVLGQVESSFVFRFPFCFMFYVFRFVLTTLVRCQDPHIDRNWIRITHNTTKAGGDQPASFCCLYYLPLSALICLDLP